MDRKLKTFYRKTMTNQFNAIDINTWPKIYVCVCVCVFILKPKEPNSYVTDRTSEVHKEFSNWENLKRVQG